MLPSQSQQGPQGNLSFQGLQPQLFSKRQMTILPNGPPPSGPLYQQAQSGNLTIQLQPQILKRGDVHVKQQIPPLLNQQKSKNKNKKQKMKMNSLQALNGKIGKKRNLVAVKSEFNGA